MGSEERAKKRKRNKLKPLIEASDRISKMLNEMSKREELFIIEEGSKKKISFDSKALKEFTSVIKDMSAIISDLNQIKEEGSISDGIVIMFDENVGECAN